MFDAGAPAATFLEQINQHIRDGGNHGHGDDLLAMAMPETQHAISLQIWPRANLSQIELSTLETEVRLFIRSAFRESTQRDYKPTRTFPQSRFSFSRLTEELHDQFPNIESMRFAGTDIVSGLNIPRIQSLSVTLQ